MHAIDSGISCYAFIIVISKLKVPLESQAQGTSLLTNAALNQSVQRVAQGRFRSGCQRVRGSRLSFKVGSV